ITTHYAFDGKHLCATYDHRPAAKAVCIGTKCFRVSLRVRSDHMIGNDVAQKVEPEQRKLSEDFSFIGNGSCKNVVERRDPVRGDEEQVVPQFVDISDFALRVKRQLQ